MDKDTDFTFMKSGFDLTGNNTVIDPDFRENMVAMITLFGENALRTSALYTKHSKRNVVSVEDLKRAMKLEVFLYMKRPDLLEKCKEIKEALRSDNEEEDEDELIEYEDGEFRESECDCALCKGLNSIHEKWEHFEPQSPIEKILKKRIDEME